MAITCFSFQPVLMSKIMLTSSGVPSCQNKKSWIRNRCDFFMCAYVFHFLLQLWRKSVCLGESILKIRACGKQGIYLVILQDGPGGAALLTQASKTEDSIMNLCSKEMFCTSNVFNLWQTPNGMKEVEQGSVHLFPV